MLRSGWIRIQLNGHAQSQRHITHDIYPRIEAKSVKKARQEEFHNNSTVETTGIGEKIISDPLVMGGVNEPQHPQH